MTDLRQIPEAARPFVRFPAVLRAHGFAVAPGQTLDFLAAVGLLGPRSMADIANAAHATLAPAPERRDEFDALFRMFFMGQTVAAPAPGGDEDEEPIRVREEGGAFELPESDETNETGGTATAAEALSIREFPHAARGGALRRFAREAPGRIPVRKGRRRALVRRGPDFDLRAVLRRAVRNDGEVIVLPRLRRKMRQRAILLLIDVSGSMKAQTEDHMRFAHALAHAAGRFEAFTLGTRLTRITPALRFRNADRALAAASGTVSDWDGGTRIGDALRAFLAIPRFAGFARGVLTLVLSDGLERGGHDAMVDAVSRLSRLAWRISWLSPLATGPGFQPQTAALKAIGPYIGELADCSSLDRLCAHVLDISLHRDAGSAGYRRNREGLKRLR